MVRVGESHGSVRIVGPALEERLICGARVARLTSALERGDRREPARLVRGGRDAIGRQRHHRPVAAAHPEELVHREGQHLALGFSRAQVELAPVVVVAHRHGVMPAVAQAEVLQHDHRIAGGDLAQEIVEARRELVGDHAVAPRGGEHLDLQAALALGDIDLRHQLVGRHLGAVGREQRGERRRPALVFALREERHALQLDALVQLARQRLAQRRALRREAGAAAEPRQNKNARCVAGVFEGLAAEAA